MATIFSYNQVIELLTDISRRHYQLNTFYLGRDWELENGFDILYPLFQVYPDFGKLTSNTFGEYKTQDVRFVCKVIDLTVPSEDNEKDVHSDTLRIAQDIVNEFSQHPFYMRSNIRLKGDVEFTPLEEFQDDVAAGWQFSLTFQMINLNTFCGMPLEDIPGYSATGPESTGIIVNVQYLTCATLPDCPVIEQIDETLINLQDQIDNLGPGALTLAQVLGYGNSTGDQDILSNSGLSIASITDNFLQLSYGSFGSRFREMFTIDTYGILAQTSNFNIQGPLNQIAQSLLGLDNTQIISDINSIGLLKTDSSNYTQSIKINNNIELNSNNIYIPNETANTLAYFNGSKYLKSVTLGSGLTLSGGVLSASAISLSVTAPLSITAGVISITQATTSTNGYLTSTDWNTFNNKQNALGFTPENVANKAITFVTLNNTLYPTTQAVANYVTAFGYITSTALAPYLTSVTAASTYVPYTGATTNIDINTRNFTTSGTTTLTGNINTGLVGTNDRIVESSAGGALTANRELIDCYLLAGSAPALLLINAANWTGVNYTGTAMTGTYQGQRFITSIYVYEAANDNQWVRYTRT